MADDNTSTETSATDVTEQTSTTATETPAQPEKDWRAESEKWQKLSREQESRAKANAKAAERLAALEESQKTEAQKVQDRADAAEARASEAERSLVRYRVAVAKQLPPELVDRLRGDTEEEMAEDADILLKLVKPKEELKPDPSQGYRGGSGAGGIDMNTLLRTAAGRG